MKVYLFDDRGEGLGEVEWKEIPRIGEEVITMLTPDAFVVEGITWDMTGAEPIPRIRLRQLIPGRN